MSIRYFIEKFKDETKVIKGHVDKKLELSKILLENMEKIVFFENLSGYKAVGNLWSTRDRIAKSFGSLKKKKL
jgi:UbiD family decarboxylase